MNFHTCGVCSRDEPRKDCTPLAELTKEISASELKVMYLEMLEPLNDSSATKYQKAYSRAVKHQLCDGLLIRAEFACRTCVIQLQSIYRKSCKVGCLATGIDDEVEEGNESDNEEEEEGNEEEEDRDETLELPSPPPAIKRNVPLLALVNGHFRGATPLELSRLTRVELSMVCLVNCIYTLSMLKKGSHWGSTATVFSVLNDVNAIASHLPRLPTLKDIALIRSAVDSTSPRDFLYSPHNVIEALSWLEENNFLWEGKFKRPEGEEWADAGSRGTMEVECIDADEEDFEDLDPDLNGVSGSDGHAVNPNAPPSNMNEVLLTGSRDQQALLRQVENTVGKRYVLCQLLFV
jgi:hypothetical protein